MLKLHGLYYVKNKNAAAKKNWIEYNRLGSKLEPELRRAAETALNLKPGDLVKVLVQVPAFEDQEELSAGSVVKVYSVSFTSPDQIKLVRPTLCLVLSDTTGDVPFRAAMAGRAQTLAKLLERV